MKKMLRQPTTCIALLLAVGLLLTACDGFLEESPRGSLNPEVLSNQEGVEALLIGAYSALNPANNTVGVAGGGAWEVSPDNWVYGSVVGGDAKKGSDASDQPNINPLMRGDVNPTNAFLDNKWKAGYEGIARTNEVLRVLEQVEEISDADRNRIAAEARFLRGHFYFDLKKMFNMIPWIDEETEEFRQPNDQDIWPNIEADFQFAMDNLPETQSDVGRANRWAAASYLAKSHLYQENWSEAKNLFDDVIVSGQTSDGQAYALVDNYQDNFNPAEQNNSETVFAIQMTGDDGSGGISNSNPGNMLSYPYNSPFRCCGFYQPSQDLVNSYQTDGGQPNVNDYNATMVTADLGVSSSDPFEVHDGTVDPRLDFSVGRRGVPFLDWGPHPGQRWIRDQAYAGPYAPKKHIYRRGSPEFENVNEWAPGSAVDVPIIRFADVLLMAAEAEANLGNLEPARDYVNQVRERAANPDSWVSTADNLAFAAATIESEAELAGLEDDVDSDEWVVNTSNNSTYVQISSGTWQEYPDPFDNYEVETYDAAWSSADEALAHIRHERKMELAMEGHRFFDLSRWGIAEETLNAYYAYEGQFTGDVAGGQFRSRAVYFPIPQRQIDLSTVEGEATLEQNQGY